MDIERYWSKLVDLNRDCAWAVPGVFAPAVGPEYIPGSPNSIVFVGKSAGGPKGALVGSTHDYQSSAKASLRWALDRRSNPRSSFWQFIDSVVEREETAWTNLIKMDQQGRDAPSETNARSIWTQSVDVLNAEFDYFRPAVAVLVTGKSYLLPEVGAFVRSRNYRIVKEDPVGDGITRCWQSEVGWLVTTRHPQGMPNRGAVVQLIRDLRTAQRR